MGHNFSNYFLFEEAGQDLILERWTGKLISVFCYGGFVQYRAKSDYPRENKNDDPSLSPTFIVP